ncbi:MAG: sigma-70 family RNA polymerase sigma factor [Caldilinea sp. CFX5]|nr:sigma-70 family RNA polymerase sigma factor [Caldilinea sp. CFX5]
MTPGELAAGCRQVKPDAGHEPYCFELFRRAILQKSEQCWSALYAQYSKLVVHWIGHFARQHAPLLTTPTEDLVTDAFTAFWRAYTPEKLGKATGLAPVLSYLRDCAVTAVLQAKRREERRIKQAAWDQEGMETTPDHQPTHSHPEQRLMVTIWQEKLWQAVHRCCHDERERILARLSFVSDLKPSEILERHPDLFADVAEIYTMRRNLKNRLWRDKELQELWGESIL